MKIIHRYILKEIWAPFLVGAAFFTLLLIAPRLKNLAELTIEKGVPVLVVIQLFVYLIPSTTVLTIPMGTLFGTLFSLNRLSGDSEIIAMRSTGISMWSISKPIIFFGIFSTVFLFLFVNFIQSKASHNYKTLYTNAVYASPMILLKNQTFVDLPGVSKKITTLAYDEEKQIMESIFIFEQKKDEQTTSIIYARQGQWISNEINSSFTKLILTDGEVIRLDSKKENSLGRVQFNKMEVNIFPDIRQIDFADKGPREQNVFELWKDIKQSKYPDYLRSFVLVELHKKISIPLACFIFVIIAIPLAISNVRSGKGASLGMTIIVIFIYYVFLNSGEAMGKYGIISPSLGMYLPNIVVGFIGIFLFIKKVRE